MYIFLKRIGMSREKNIQNNRKKTIYSLICAKEYVPMREKEIAALLDIPRAKRRDLTEVLEELIRERKIEKTLSGRYQKYRSPEGIDDRKGRYSSGGRELKAGRTVYAGGAAGSSQDGRGGGGKRIRTGGFWDRSVLDESPAEAIGRIVDAYGLPVAFSPRAAQMTERLPGTITDEDLEGRLDLRSQCVITIDGTDSRDFDDAVSLEKTGGSYILGVHIADVGRYVPWDCALDRDARARGTSVYLPDRVIPMLPERLSNDLCSLNEGEDRLTLSCILKISRKGEVLSGRITESVICSAHRMTYDDVDRIITDRDPELCEAYRDIVPMLFEMKNLADALENRRKERGMIGFDFPETKFELDEEGHPLRLWASRATAATRLIEQFMLTANEFVAGIYEAKGIPFLYRVHDKPDEDKLEEALYVIRKLDPEGRLPAVRSLSRITPADIRDLLAAAEELPQGPAISNMLLRSMRQAVYSAENAGHFGIAAAVYCHFTSPIRRYPDLMIHRIIKDDLHGRLTDKLLREYRRCMDDIAQSASVLERRAAEVEREAVKRKMAEYAEKHIGEVQEGTVSGVTSWGIYVQLDNTLEGLVHVTRLDGDYYEFDEGRMELRGTIEGRVFSIGQRLKVRITDADPEKRTVDFCLEDDIYI